MRANRGRGVTGACIILFCAVGAWLTSGYAETLVRSLHESSYEAPHLPYVGMVPWITVTDFYSAPGQMGMGLLLAAALALLVEVAKAVLARWMDYRVYLGALLFQVAVTWAAFENGAADWAFHFKSLFFWNETRVRMADIYSPDPTWSWSSTATLLLLCGVTLVRMGRTVEPEGDPAGPRFRLAGNPKGWIWLGIAWLLGALAPIGIDAWFSPSAKWPHLGNVAAAPWDAAGETQSTTVRLAGACFFAVLGVLLVEIVKALQIRRGRGSAFWPLLAFQVVLFCDVVASAAPDWAAYALSSVLGVPVPVEALPSWPWISLLALSLLLLPDLRRFRDLNP